MKNNESPEDFLEVLSAATNKRARFVIDTSQKRVTKNVPNFRDNVHKISQLTRCKWKQQKIAQSPAIKGIAVIFLKKKRMKINQLWLCIYCEKRILSNMKNTTTPVSKCDLSLKISLFLGIKKEKTKQKILVTPDVHLKDWMFESIVLSKLSELRRAILSEDMIKYIYKMNYHV